MPPERRTPNRPHIKARKGPASARRPKRLIREPKAVQILIVIPQLVPQPPRRAPKRTASDVSLQRALEGKRHKSDGVRRAPHLDRLEEYARAMAQQCTTVPREAPHRPARPYSGTKETREDRRFKRKAEKLRRSDIERRELRIRLWNATAYSGPMVLDHDMICVTVPPTSSDLDVQMGFFESEPSYRSDVMEARVDGTTLTAPAKATQGPTVVTSSAWSNNRPPTEEGSSTRRARVVLNVTEDTQMSEISVPVVVEEKATPPVPATLNTGITKRSQGGAMTTVPATYTPPTAAAASTSRHRPSPLRASTTKTTIAAEALDAQQAPEQRSVMGTMAAPAQVKETTTPAVSTPPFGQQSSIPSALAAGPAVNETVPSSSLNAPLVLPRKSNAAPRKANGLLRTALDAATRLKLSSAWAMSNTAASSSGSSPVAVLAPVHVPQRGPAFTSAIGGPPTSPIGLTDRKGKGKATASQSTTANTPMSEAEFQAALEAFAESPSTSPEVPPPQALIGAPPFPVQVQGLATGSQQLLPKVAYTVPATATDIRPVPTSASVPSPAPAQSADVTARKTRRLPRSAMAKLASTEPSSASSAPASTSATPSSSGTSAFAPVPALVDTPHQGGTSAEASGSRIPGDPSSAQIGSTSGPAGSSHPRIANGVPTPSTERTDRKGKGKASDHRKHLAEWGLDVDEEEEEAQNDRRAFHAAFRNAKGAGGGLIRSRR